MRSQRMMWVWILLGEGTNFELYSRKDLTGEFIGYNKYRIEILSYLPKVEIIKIIRRIKKCMTLFYWIKYLIR